MENKYQPLTREDEEEDSIKDTKEGGSEQWQQAIAMSSDSRHLPDKIKGDEANQVGKEIEGMKAKLKSVQVEVQRKFGKLAKEKRAQAEKDQEDFDALLNEFTRTYHQPAEPAALPSGPSPTTPGEPASTSSGTRGEPAPTSSGTLRTQMTLSGNDIVSTAKPRVTQGEARRERRRRMFLTSGYNRLPTGCACEDLCCNEPGVPTPPAPFESDEPSMPPPPAPIGTLAALATVEPESLNSVHDGWEEIDFTVDSGASETVLHEDMLRSVETKPSPASRRGVEYEVANGVRIPNMGQKEFKAETEDGAQKILTAQVCEVSKALLSVKKVVAAGNRVVFEPNQAFIENLSTGQRLSMRQEGGMYTLKMWVKVNNPNTGF